jgi:Uma2 family endonuclease
MSSTLTAPWLTLHDLEALPEDDRVRRWLVRGELREEPMTRRHRLHSLLEGWLAHLLWTWVEQMPHPRGQVHSGEGGFRIRRDPDTVVGIDVAYIDATLASADPVDTTLIDGVPTLAVEILSPSTTLERLHEKLDLYREAGVPLVWIVDPYARTITIHQPEQPPRMVNVEQTLDAEPHLPGFAVPVARVFER